jgi:hypothetical protein
MPVHKAIIKVEADRCTGAARMPPIHFPVC